VTKEPGSEKNVVIVASTVPIVESKQAAILMGEAAHGNESDNGTKQPQAGIHLPRSRRSSGNPASADLV
jgi:hypothetical protein